MSTTTATQLEAAIEAALQDNPLLERDPNERTFSGAQGYLTTLWAKGNTPHRVLLKTPRAGLAGKLTQGWELECEITKQLQGTDPTIIISPARTNINDRPYLLRPYYAGITLEQLFQLNRKETTRCYGDNSIPVLATIAHDLLHTLKTTQRLGGIVHQDIKPENIILTPTGKAELVDWGLAALLPQLEEEYQNTKEKNPKTIIGNAVYMSFEQMQGIPAAATDIYSIGLVFADLYSPKRREWIRAFRSPIEILNQRIRYETEIVTEMLKKAPNAVQEFIKECTTKNPEQRLERCQKYLDEPIKVVQMLNQSPSPNEGFLTEGRRNIEWYANR